RHRPRAAGPPRIRTSSLSAFSVSGATLFSVLSSGEVDQRLVLAGYRPHELLFGRLLFLAPMGIAIAGAFTLLMTVVSHPTRPALTLVGLAAVALVSIPFGLAVGSAVPRELEGTLVLIGVVGLQLAIEPTSPVAHVLPFYGPRTLIASSLGASGPILWPLLLTMAYGIGLFVLARLLVGRRVGVERHARVTESQP
ncbi:MAG: hypothetical protein ABJC79_00555, partial [Acidimicrobiia bacterium]